MLINDLVQTKPSHYIIYIIQLWLIMFWCCIFLVVCFRNFKSFFIDKYYIGICKVHCSPIPSFVRALGYREENAFFSRVNLNLKWAFTICSNGGLIELFTLPNFLIQFYRLYRRNFTHFQENWNKNFGIAKKHKESARHTNFKTYVHVLNTFFKHKLPNYTSNQIKLLQIGYPNFSYS